MNDVAIDTQAKFWNEWNAAHREHGVAEVSSDQAAAVLSRVARIGRHDLKIVEVGCGSGWLCDRLVPFGDVTGTDLSDQVLARAAQRTPQATFVAGDFMELAFAETAYDVAISLEVLSHVADQAAFLRKMSCMLKPGGLLIIATQNRPVLERNDIPPPQPGQLRQWVDRSQLRALIEVEYAVEDLFSMTPKYDRGALRIINSGKVRRLAGQAGLAGVMARLKRVQEQAWMGWTLVAYARKR
jgi:2-polyprenyl-3-methyl-5-hydroxy-6-metoxy-1,4-benzoquinol methylase